jgi:hypothetical protein
MNDPPRPGRSDNGAVRGGRQVVQHLVLHPLDLGSIEAPIAGPWKADGM